MNDIFILYAVCVRVCVSAHSYTLVTEREIHRHFGLRRQQTYTHAVPDIIQRPHLTHIQFLTLFYVSSVTATTI